MFRILTISDLHIEDGRLDRQVPVLEQVAADAAVLKPDLILVPGDLFGHRVPHRSSPHERMVAVDFLRSMAAQAPVVIAYGNHDAPEDLDVFAVLESTWPIHVVEAAERITVRTKGGPADVCVLAYPRRRALLDGEDLPRGPEHVRRTMNAKIEALLDAWTVLTADSRKAGIPVIFTAHVQTRGCHTSGGEILAENEIEIGRDLLDKLAPDFGGIGHIHLRQEVADRVWYPGSPWPVDHGEQERKAYLVTDLWRGVGSIESTYLLEGLPDDPRRVLGDDRILDYEDSPADHRMACRVWSVETGAVPLRTLIWKWGVPDGGDEPEWLSTPTLGPGAVVGCEVKVRLVTTAKDAGSCPWGEELEAYRNVALEWKEERVIEPVISVRNPEVSEAETLPEKIRAYWRTLGDGAPEKAEQGSALVEFQEIEEQGMETVKQGIRTILEEV